MTSARWELAVGRFAEPPDADLHWRARSKGDAMKIARIETFLFDPGTAKNLLFCRIETESGVHGWGEAYVTPGKEQVIEHLLRDLAKYMIGRDAFSIRHTAQVMFEDFAMRRTSLDLMSAWSAIEIAMWDIVAKARRPTAVQHPRRRRRGSG